MMTKRVQCHRHTRGQCLSISSGRDRNKYPDEERDSECGLHCWRIDVSEGNFDNPAMVTNLATVAVVPASQSVPIENFTLELQHALGAIGTYCS